MLCLSSWTLAENYGFLLTPSQTTSHLWVEDHKEKLGGNGFQQEHSLKLNSN